MRSFERKTGSVSVLVRPVSLYMPLSVSLCFWPVSTLQCALTHIFKQWGRSDSDQGALCVCLRNYLCLLFLVCLSVCVFSSPFIMQTVFPLSSPPVYNLGSFCPYLFCVYRCHHSLTSPSPSHSFILSYCYH